LKDKFKANNMNVRSVKGKFFSNLINIMLNKIQKIGITTINHAKLRKSL